MNPEQTTRSGSERVSEGTPDPVPRDTPRWRPAMLSGNWVLLAALLGFMTFSYWTTAPEVAVVEVPASAPAQPPPAVRHDGASGREQTQIEAPSEIQDTHSESPASERAHQLFDAGQEERAIAVLTRALLAQPGDAELAVDLGVLLLRSGRREEATARFEQAVRLAPTSEAAYYNLGTAEIKLGRIEEAIESLRSAVKINPHHSDALYNLGVALSRKGDEAGATQAYLRTIEVDRGRTGALAHTNLGVLQKRHGKLREALTHFEAALRSQPGFAKARFDKALTLSHLERSEEAEAEYRKLIDVEPKHVSGRINLATLLMRKKSWDGAIALLRAVIEDEPKSASAHYDLGLCYVRKGNDESAAEAFERALDLRPDHAATAYNLGLARKRQGRLQEAVQRFRDAARLVPDRAKYRYSLALALSMTGDVSGAIEIYRAALALRPDYYAALYKLALLEYGQGHYDAARANLEKARAARADSHEAAYELGLCWLALDRPERAEAVLREALQLESNAAVHYQLGVALMRQRHLDDAVASLKATLRADPKYRDALARLAEIRVEQGDEKRARQRLVQLQQLDPNDETAFAIAAQKYDQKRYEEAIHYWEISLRGSDSLRRRSLQRTGSARIQLGNLTGAIATLRGARQAFPGDYSIVRSLAAALDRAGQHAEARKILEADGATEAEIGARGGATLSDPQR